MTSALGNECLMSASRPALFCGLIQEEMFGHSASLMDALDSQLAVSSNLDTVYLEIKYKIL